MRNENDPNRKNWEQRGLWSYENLKACNEERENNYKRPERTNKEFLFKSNDEKLKAWEKNSVSTSTKE